MTVRKAAVIFEDLWFGEQLRWGIEWGRRVRALNENKPSLRERWFSVPFIEGEGVDAVDLTAFATVGVSSRAPIRPIWLKSLEARFWLAILCDESPDTCAPYANQWPRYE